jgi:hypothetical protein
MYASLRLAQRFAPNEKLDTPGPHIYHLAFLLLGIIMSVTGFFILFLRAQAVFAYNHQLPPKMVRPEVCRSTFS